MWLLKEHQWESIAFLAAALVLVGSCNLSYNPSLLSKFIFLLVFIYAFTKDNLIQFESILMRVSRWVQGVKYEDWKIFAGKIYRNNTNYCWNLMLNPTTLNLKLIPSIGTPFSNLFILIGDLHDWSNLLRSIFFLLRIYCLLSSYNLTLSAILYLETLLESTRCYNSVCISSVYKTIKHWSLV